MTKIPSPRVMAECDPSVHIPDDLADFELTPSLGCGLGMPTVGIADEKHPESRDMKQGEGSSLLEKSYWRRFFWVASILSNPLPRALIMSAPRSASRCSKTG